MIMPMVSGDKVIVSGYGIPIGGSSATLFLGQAGVFDGMATIAEVGTSEVARVSVQHRGGKYLYHVHRSSLILERRKAVVDRRTGEHSAPIAGVMYRHTKQLVRVSRRHGAVVEYTPLEVEEQWFEPRDLRKIDRRKTDV